MAIHINESGSLKTVGTSSNIFIECFGIPSYNSNGSDGNGITILNLPKNTYIQYQLPFTPSKVFILCRFVWTSTTFIPMIGLTQGETLTTLSSAANWAHYGDGRYGPSSVQLSGDKLIFGVYQQDENTFFSGIVIAKE